MLGALFSHFGDINDPQKEFTDNEKESLRLALEYVDYIIFKVNKASIRNFEGDLDKIKLWFGDTSPEVIVQLKKNTYKLISILTTPEIFIRFINAREEYFHRSIAKRIPGNTEIDQRYENAILQGGPRSMTSEYLNAYVHPLSWVDPNDKCSGHVGSVMNIYVGNYFFARSRTFLMMAHTIIHELSHKVIDSVDYAYRTYPTNKKIINEGYFQEVYGRINCKALAREAPKEAMRNADCIAFFFVAL